MHHKIDDDRQQYQQAEGQSPFDGEHGDECAQNGHGGDQHVLGTVVRQLRHLEQIVGHPGEEFARADAVIEGERQGLDMGEDVPPHVRLNEGTQPVAPVADDVLENGTDEVCADEADDEQHEDTHQGAVHGHCR